MPKPPKQKILPPLPSKEPAARPWWWYHDKTDGMWYLARGPKDKPTSVIPGLQAWDDFDTRPEAKLILTAVNQYDIVRELITTLTRYTRSVEEEYQTLTDGQFGKFNNKPVGQALAKVIVKLLEIHESKH